ncbi:hypothetical protein Pint_02346 [Pistacia integerrima]|uniref:Uncharacterized protein n=1 Tax=Pistacia integerrima TaxID=434235 RepID=A0ACC0ZL07_9ROSI|nr:hypothetical protein Pint_02346 [Pistacia integerrima]
MAEATAKAFPEIQCTIFGLPHIADNLQGTKNLTAVQQMQFCSSGFYMTGEMKIA